MQLSRRADYALRAVIDLAIESDGGRVQLREIAARQAIPEKYLEQLLRLLKTAGVVHATRGSRGGYQLAKAADELTVLAVFEAVEGPLGAEESDGMGAGRGDGALVVRAFWEELTDGLRAQLGALTAAQLAERYRRLRSSHDDWVI